MIRILLVCGSGASSGFMAANLRKSAKKEGVEVKVTARGESEIESYIDDIDALMVGPHLEYILDDIEGYIGDADVTVVLMKPEYYSTLDGEKALKHLLEVMKVENTK